MIRSRLRSPALMGIVLVVALVLSLLVGCGGSDEPEAPVTSDLRGATVTRLPDMSNTLVQPMLLAEHRIPGGSIVEVDAPTTAAVRTVTGLAHPLQTFSLLDLGSGAMTPVLEQAVGHDAGFDIVDVRATDSAAIWVETNMTLSQWKVLAAPLSGKQLGQPRALDEGGEGTLLPSIAIDGAEVLWLTVPDPDAGESPDAAVLKVVNATSAEEPRELLVSTKTVSSLVTVADGVATVSERARVSGVRQSTLRAIDIASGDDVALLEIPAPINPSYATYLDGRFAFSVPARYDGVGALGDVGTYLQVEGGEFVRVTRQPMDTPAFLNGRFVVKDGKSIVLVDAASQVYASLPTVDKSPDYGEYLASNGIASSVVTFTSPEVDDREQPFTIVRVFSY